MACARDCPYCLLGIPATAKAEEIKAAYKPFALLHHPDRNPGDEVGAGERFRRYTAARDAVLEPDAATWKHKWTHLFASAPAASPAGSASATPRVRPQPQFTFERPEYSFARFGYEMGLAWGSRNRQK
jgi:curved DNA-binding protein CbpA